MDCYITVWLNKFWWLRYLFCGSRHVGYMGIPWINYECVYFLLTLTLLGLMLAISWVLYMHAISCVQYVRPTMHAWWSEGLTLWFCAQKNAQKKYKYRRTKNRDKVKCNKQIWIGPQILIIMLANGEFSYVLWMLICL